MSNQISHRTRMEACLSGKVLDRPPIALWRHFPVDDQTAQRLAAATISFQQLYDFDFVKVTPSSSFCLQDWGVKDEWRGSTEGVREYTHYAIRNVEDWMKLKLLDPYKGWLGEQLDCLQQITSFLGADVPVIQTIFNPLSQAKNLVGGENLLVYLRRNPEELQIGLQTITETTLRFVEAACQTGISGIFFAVQHARYGLLSEQEYLTFGKGYDLQILEAAEHLWLNLLHLHGEDIMFNLFLDYPAAVMNWHDQETYPSLKESQQKFKGVVCGGLRQWKTMALGSPEDVRREAHEAFESTDGKRFILGTGCVTPIIAPHANLLATRQSYEEMSS